MSGYGSLLYGTVIRTRIVQRATKVSVLAGIGVSRDGQKVVLSTRTSGAESTEAWRQFLDDPDAGGPKRPGFVIADGAPGLAAALVTFRGDHMPTRRGTVHKPRNLLANVPKTLQHKLTEDCRDMTYADTGTEIEPRRNAFLRKWCLKCRAVADCLKDDGRPALHCHPP